MPPRLRVNVVCMAQTKRAKQPLSSRFSRKKSGYARGKLLEAMINDEEEEDRNEGDGLGNDDDEGDS